LVMERGNQTMIQPNCEEINRYQTIKKVQL
jgi:hypothetical protein